MSQTIDERVVEMRFDNDQFEKGVRQSQKSITAFEKSISALNGTNAGLDKLSSTLSTISLDSISSSVEYLQNRFSAMGIVGMRVLQNITDSLMGFVGKVNNFLIGGITSGGLSRAMNIENAKFQLEGLGVAWEKVSEDIDYGVKDTAYGLDAAAMAASQLATSGVEFGGVYKEGAEEISEMGRALRAISGVAAMTNSDYSSIADIFVTVAGNGKLMGDQIRMLSYRGLNAAANLADFFNSINDGSIEATDAVTDSVKKMTKGLNIGEKEIREFVTKGLISFDIFSEAMDSTFGAHAKEANKTLNGSFSNMKAAMSRIGALFISPVIEQDSPLIQLINSFTKQLNNFKKEITPVADVVTDFVNTLLYSAKIATDAFSFNFSGIGDTFYSVIYAILGVLGKFEPVLKKVKDGFNDIFPFSLSQTIRKLIDDFVDMLNKFEISDEVADKLTSTFKGVAAILNLIRQAFANLSPVLDPIKESISSIAMKFLDFTAAIGDFLVGLDAAAKEGNFFAEAANGIGKAFKGIISIIKKFADSIPDFKLPDLSKVNGPIQAFKKLMHGAIELIGELISQTDKLDKALKLTGVTVAQAWLFDRLRLLWNSFKTLNPLYDLSSVITSLSTALTNFGASVKADMLRSIAISIGILAASLTVLTLVDSDKLVGAMTAIVGLFVTLGKGFSLINTAIMDFKFATAVAAAGIMLSMSAAIGILALAVKALDGIDVAGAAKGLISIMVLMKSLAMAMSDMSKIGISGSSGFLSMVGIATAVLILTSAVKKLADIDVKSLGQGLAAITVFMTEFSMLMASAKIGKIGVSSGLAFLGVAAAILMLQGVIETLGNMDTGALVKGIGAITVLITAIGTVSAVLGALSATSFKGFNGKQLTLTMLAMAVAFQGMAVAVNMLSASVMLLGNMPVEKLIQGIGAIVGIIAVFGTFGAIADKLSASILPIYAMIGALTLLSAAMTAFVVPLAVLGAMDLSNILKAFGAVLAIFATFGLFGILSTKMISMLPQMMTMIGVLALLGVTLAILTPSLLALGAAGPVVAVGLIALAGGLAIFAGVSYALSEAIPFIEAAGLALLTLAASAAIASVGASVLVSAVASLAAVGGSGAMEAAEALITLAATIPDVMVSVAQGLVAFLQTLSSFSPQIIASVSVLLGTIIIAINNTVPLILGTIKNILLQVIELVRSVIPPLVDASAELMKSFLQSIASRMGEITVAAGDIIIAFTNGLTAKIPEIVQAAINLTVAFLNGLADGVRNNHAIVVSAMINLMSAVLEALIATFNTFGQIGWGMIVSLVQGINDAKDEVIIKIIGFVDDIITSITSKLGDFVQAGKDVVGGFVSGITSTISNVVTAAWDLGKKAIDTLRQAVDAHSDSVEGHAAGWDTGHGFGTGILDTQNYVNNASETLGLGALMNMAKGVKEGEPYLQKSLKGMEEISSQTRQAIQNDASLATSSWAEMIATSMKVKQFVRQAKNEKTSGYYVAAHEMNKAVKETGEEADKAKKSVDSLSTSLGKAGGAAKKAGEDAKHSLKSWQDLEKTLSDTIDSQMDIFSEFDKKTELTGDQLLANMRSQVEGVAEWAYNMQKLSARGVNNVLLQELSQLGPQGYEKVNAFMQMTDEQLQEANKLYEQRLAMPDAAAEAVVAGFAQAGMWATEGFTNALDYLAAKKAGMEFAKGAPDGAKEELGINSPSKVMQEQVGEPAAEGVAVGMESPFYLARIKVAGMHLGQAAIEGLMQVLNGGTDISGTSETAIASFVGGIVTSTGQLTDAATNLCAQFIKTLTENLPEQTFYDFGVMIFTKFGEGLEASNKQVMGKVTPMMDKLKKQIGDTFTKIGEFAAQGMAKGIEKRIKDISKATLKATKAAETAAKSKKGLNENSPSKKFFQIGEYVTIGLAQGITSAIGESSAAIENVSANVLQKFQNAVDKVQQMADFDTGDMTLTPVLDLSMVEEGLNTASNLFSGRTISLGATVDNARLAAATFNRMNAPMEPTNPEPQTVNNYTTFNQTNTSPKALSNSEVYRQTNNLISKFRNR